MKTNPLNSAQEEAVRHLRGPMMVLAGPGSGKTTVIIHRVVNLIENGIPPRDILVITFTKAAAVEIEERFKKIYTSAERGITFGTFHSVFFRILMRQNYSLANVLAEDRRREALKKIIQAYAEDTELEDVLSDIINEISLIKNDLLSLRHYNSKTLASETFRNIFEHYESFKAENNLIDFDDMLTKCHELLLNNTAVLNGCRRKYKYILIDEFQDINRAQYECIKLIAGENPNLFIVGDDDQSIYKFRGARPEFLLSFPKDYPDTKRVILDTNYRSTENIIRASNRVIARNQNRYEKLIKGRLIEGGNPRVIYSDDIGAEALEIGKRIKAAETTFSEIAVLYRTNIQARAFVDAFMGLNIPYKLRDEMPTIYEHWVCKDICAYLRLALDNSCNQDLARIINKPSRYINKGIVSGGLKRTNNLLRSLMYDKGLAHWQKQKLEELFFYLNAIKKRGSYEAIRYIRKAVGYDEYIKDYCNYRGMSITGLTEVLNELTESSKQYESIEDYLAHVQEALERKNDDTPTTNHVTLSTLHSAKGLEFDTVYIAGAVEGVIPYEKSKTPADLEEERRLFYVGMTRAKRSLFFSVTRNRYETEAKASTFLEELIADSRSKK